MSVEILDTCDFFYTLLRDEGPTGRGQTNLNDPISLRAHLKIESIELGHPQRAAVQKTHRFRIQSLELALWSERFAGLILYVSEGARNEALQFKDRAVWREVGILEVPLSEKPSVVGP